MSRLSQALSYLITLAMVLGLIWMVRHFLSRVTVPADYAEITVPDAETMPTYTLDAVPFSALQKDQVVAYRLAQDRSDHGTGTGFAWIAAVPGDVVGISKGQLLVNGLPCSRCPELPGHPECPVFPVPAGHLYVVTTGHATDSLARGPLPAAMVEGVVENFP